MASTVVLCFVPVPVVEVIFAAEIVAVAVVEVEVEVVVVVVVVVDSFRVCASSPACAEREPSNTPKKITRGRKITRERKALHIINNTEIDADY